MKLIQRIVLAYYRIKFKALERVSLAKATKEVFELFCTPYSKRRSYDIPSVFLKANKLSFTFKNHDINGFSWKPDNSIAPKVLICHGFDSNSYRFERYIEPLLKEGFEVFAFDAPGHGVSSGKTITALLYRDMILKINADYGPFEAIMAHSFGGIAVALAIEKVKMNDLKRLVLVAPATETTRSLNDFCRFLSISDKLKEEMEKLILQIEGHPSSWYSVARIIQSVTIPTLWLHDKGDTITPYKDMEFLTRLELPNVDFVITEGLGHSLYRDDTIAEKILSFIAGIKS
ncbi:alpha/beta hydrolase [Segetibacter koreensis]|uniref:alpha/beta hydrolase n=1 Tax=Segetibacter koreensis TaxID=398037 RepID=UPI00037F7328|nr:alpha/beta hydrolase [Segetibacter koreensis]